MTQAAEQSTTCAVLAYPTRRKRAYPSRYVRQSEKLPANVVRLHEPSTLPRTATTLLLASLLSELGTASRKRVLNSLGERAYDTGDPETIKALTFFLTTARN